MLHLTSDIVYALSWALVHSVWQGLLVYTLLRAVLTAMPGNYSSTRYITAVSALALLTGSFIATFFYQYSASSGTIQHTISGAASAGQPAVSTTIVAISEDHSIVNTLSAWYNAHTQLVVNIYLAGMLLLLIRIAYNLYTLKNLKYSGTTTPGINWMLMLNDSMDKLGIDRNVQLFLSSRVLVPTVMGSLKPVILIPLALANKLSTAEAEAILLHELAHIRRHDYLVNMVQLLIETVLFYNPFVWLISSVVRKEREHCCDDIVVGATTAPLPYARALATLETFRQQPVLPSLAATGSNNQLLNRIKRIMEMRNKNVNYSQLAAVLLVVVLLAGAITFFAPGVQAQSKKDKKKEQDKTEKTSTVKKQVIIKSEMDIDENSNGDDKQLQKNVVIVKNGDTVKNYSINKILAETDATLDEVFGMLEEMDIEEIVDGAMAGVDWKSLRDSIDVEMDGREISKEVREALAEARKEMAAARIEMAEASKEYRSAMAEARREMNAARKEMVLHDAKDKTTSRRLVYSSSHDHILDAMETDGLISREKGYKIEKKDDELYIDGIKQSKEVFKKYEPIIDAKNLTIKGSNNNISIKVEK
ncbi:MAG TPA: M56 family metallopeptidase [Flavipsychrobacter sp.]